MRPVPGLRFASSGLHGPGEGEQAIEVEVSCEVRGEPVERLIDGLSEGEVASEDGEVLKIGAAEGVGGEAAVQIGAGYASARRNRSFRTSFDAGKGAGAIRPLCGPEMDLVS